MEHTAQWIRRPRDAYLREDVILRNLRERCQPNLDDRRTDCRR